MSEPIVIEAVPVVASRCVLGESPLWDPAAEAFVWVDIRGGAIFRWTPATDRLERVAAAPFVGGIVLGRAPGRYVVATSGAGLCGFSFEGGLEPAFAHPIAGVPERRYNEMKCAPDGAIWIGTMHPDGVAPVGELLRIAAPGDVSVVDRAIFIPNALGFRGERFTFVDTRAGTIGLYGGGARRDLFARDAFPGDPDGLALDTAGGYWNARFGAGAVVRFDDEGRVDTVVRLPATQVTACAFGGSRMGRLFVTTSRRMLSDAQLLEQDTAGDCFAADVPFAGVPEPRCAFA